MQVCTALQTDNHASTPPLSFYRPDALLAAQPTASKHWRHKSNTFSASLMQTQTRQWNLQLGSLFCNEFLNCLLWTLSFFMNQTQQLFLQINSVTSVTMCSFTGHAAFGPQYQLLAPNIQLLLHTNNTRLTALCPGLPGWAGTRRVEPIWILLKQQTVSGSGISSAICKSTPHSRQITMPAPHHSVFYRLDALPATQPTVSKHWRQGIQEVLLLLPKIINTFV